jgi:hypothetical protein
MGCGKLNDSSCWLPDPQFRSSRLLYLYSFLYLLLAFIGISDIV